MNTTSTKNSWDLNGTDLACVFPDATVGKFDLEVLFPDFTKFNEVQALVVAYGVKQKLSDSCARPKDAKLTFKEAAEQMADTFQMLASGKFTSGTRAGAISYKRKIEAAKESATPAELKVLKKLGLIS